MKNFAFGATSLALLLVVGSVRPADAVLIASYESGVAATAGTVGAADPTSQGWSATGAVTGFSHGQDSVNGGWRITDGTSGQPYFYQQSLSGADIATMDTVGWIATWTTAVNADAVQDTGVPNGVNDYYSSVPSRQNNNAMWVENSGGGYRYILTFEADANNDIILSDGTTDFQITTANNQLSEELGTGAPSANYVTFTLAYNPTSGNATLSDSLNGVLGVIATSGIATQDRIVWGATSSSGQGSTTWNRLEIATPEPSTFAMLCLGALGLTATRRRLRS